MIAWIVRQLAPVYEWARARDGFARRRNLRYSSGPEPGGVPLPPDRLRVRVAGTADIESFLDGGARGAATVRRMLELGGLPVEQCRAILDFGCGCGRILRFWKDTTGPQWYGTDINDESVAWCRSGLGFAQVSVNALEPPCAYPPGAFDAVYAFSVFTHLPLASQRAWLSEFRRILAPGGLLLFSTHGRRYLPRLNRREQQLFTAGELVVRLGQASGSNFCNAFHPEEFVRRDLAEGWGIVAFEPEGAAGNPRQDAWLLRRALG